MPRFIKLIALLVTLSVALTGCGSSSPDGPAKLDYGGPDATKVAEMVSELNEVKHSQARLKAFFSGGLPTDWKNFDKYDFNVQGKVTVTGPEASATVSGRPETGTGETVTKTWTFVKDGEKWKVKSAPIS